MRALVFHGPGSRSWEDVPDPQLKDPEDAIAYLGQLSQRVPDAVVVCADDGEKFGGWPETHKHCYTNRWLRRFFDLLRQNRRWLRFCTLSQALDETPAAGLVSRRRQTRQGCWVKKIRYGNPESANPVKGKGCLINCGTY